MKIIVVEPHPDDAFLSLGWHLEKLWKNEDRTILTVYADSKRSKEAEAYADSIGAKSIVLGLEESKMLSSRTVRRIPEIADFFNGNGNRPKAYYHRVLFPIGLQHPDHLDVAASRIPGSARYLDTPYQTKQKLADCLLEKVDGMIVGSLLFPPKMKWRKAAIFKSQAKFFYYNEKLYESLLPEMTLEYPSTVDG